MTCFFDIIISKTFFTNSSISCRNSCNILKFCERDSNSETNFIPFFFEKSSFNLFEPRKKLNLKLGCYKRSYKWRTLLRASWRSGITVLSFKRVSNENVSFLFENSRRVPKCKFLAWLAKIPKCKLFRCPSYTSYNQLEDGRLPRRTIIFQSKYIFVTMGNQCAHIVYIKWEILWFIIYES